MHVPYLGPQHSAVIDVMRAVAIRASTSLPLLDSLGAAAQQLPHNDPAGGDSCALPAMPTCTCLHLLMR